MQASRRRQRVERPDRELVREWMDLGELSQPKAAIRLGSSQAALNQFLSDREGGELSFATMARWAKVIGCDPDVFVKAKFSATT